MSKQTAVEWLIEQIKIDQNEMALTPTEWMQVFEQARQVEKEQIVDAWHSSHVSTMTGEQYYKETYESNT